MLLLYLYTLEDPNFADEKLFYSSVHGADPSLKLAIRYDLLEFGKADEQFIIKTIGACVSRSFMIDTEHTSSMIRFVEMVWSSWYFETKMIRWFPVGRIAPIVGDILDCPEFRSFCINKPEFSLELIRILSRGKLKTLSLCVRKETVGRRESTSEK